MKKLIKNLTILVTFNLLLLSSSLAVNTDEIKKFFANPDGKAPDPTEVTNTILGYITYIGYVLAVIIVLAVGVQFLTATPQKKAQLKEKLWLIVIGVAVLVGGIPTYMFIWDILEDIRKAFN